MFGREAGRQERREGGKRGFEEKDAPISKECTCGRGRGAWFLVSPPAAEG